MSLIPKPRLVVVGSSNTDLVVRCLHLPKPGETVLGGDFVRFNGGKGANQAVAAARAGAQVIFIGARGDDDFGAAAKEAIHREGVDVQYFRIRKGTPSGVALILVGGTALENMIAVAKSANNSLAPKDLKAARSVFQKSQAVLCQLEIPMKTVEAAAKLAGEYGVSFILNPAPGKRLPQGLFKLVHTLIPNEHEAALLTGFRDSSQAARALLKKGCRNVVITLGARGALIANKNAQKVIPAPRVKPVDTVGAGDCFTAWVSVGVAEGLSLEKAVKRAVRAASLSVTRPGAQSGMPYRWEV